MECNAFYTTLNICTLQTVKMKKFILGDYTLYISLYDEDAYHKICVILLEKQIFVRYEDEDLYTMPMFAVGLLLCI